MKAIMRYIKDIIADARSASLSLRMTKRHLKAYNEGESNMIIHREEGGE